MDERVGDGRTGVLASSEEERQHHHLLRDQIAIEVERTAGLIDHVDVGDLPRRGDRGAEQRRDREGTPAHHLMKTIFATEGTPRRLRMKSMYGPGGESAS